MEKKHTCIYKWYCTIKLHIKTIWVPFEPLYIWMPLMFSAFVTKIVNMYIQISWSFCKVDYDTWTYTYNNHDSFQKQGIILFILSICNLFPRRLPKHDVVNVVNRLARTTDVAMWWRHFPTCDDIILNGSKWLADFMLDFIIMKTWVNVDLDICLMTLFCMDVDLDDLHILLWISRCTSRSSLDLHLHLDVF